MKPNKMLEKAFSQKANVMYKFFKRFFDIVFSFLAIVILLPIFLIVSACSAMFIGTPIIFKQPRPGKDGKIFYMYKFRSMTNKKDVNGILLPDSQRITKFGKFIRKTSLDELPQLFNILKGDMSFVGPRPRIVEECVFLNENQNDRFKVRPGITGLAQVNGRNNITFDKVVEFDKIYVEHCSLATDVKILFKTVGCVFLHKDINKAGTVSNEFYGDYLLRTKQISFDYYFDKIQLANAKKEIGFLFDLPQKRLAKQSGISKKQAKQAKKAVLADRVEDFDYDLEEKTVK